MNPVIAVLLIALVFVSIATFMTLTDRSNRERINREILEAGGEPIEISYRLLDFDQYNHSYAVQFADELGRKHETLCKIHIFSRRVYWEHSPAELLSDLPDERIRWRHLEVDTSDSKEQIIADLAAENERLQQELAALSKVNGAGKPN
jgi:hypothetical protein